MGANINWDYIERISPAIPLLQQVKDVVKMNINQNPRYRVHTTPQKEHDVAELTKLFCTEKVYTFSEGRAVSEKNRPIDRTRKGATSMASEKWFNDWKESRLHDRSGDEEYLNVAELY
jgi:hypothetical protein